MKPIYTMVIKDHDAFTKLKDQVVIWNSANGSKPMSLDSIKTINAQVLMFILSSRMDDAMISYRPAPFDVLYEQGKKLMETVLTVREPEIIDLIINDFNKYAGAGLNGVFDVKNNAIVTSVEKSTGIIKLCVYDTIKKIKEAPKPLPVVEINTDNDVWYNKLQVLAEIAGIPIKRKVDAAEVE